MSRLIKNLHALEAIEQEWSVLAIRKEALERQARALSGPTDHRANRMLAHAVLRLLSKGQVDREDLEHALAESEGAGDRFALALCWDRLGEIIER